MIQNLRIQERIYKSSIEDFNNISKHMQFYRDCNGPSTDYIVFFIENVHKYVKYLVRKRKIVFVFFFAEFAKHLV